MYQILLLAAGLEPATPDYKSGAEFKKIRYLDIFCFAIMYRPAIGQNLLYLLNDLSRHPVLCLNQNKCFKNNDLNRPYGFDPLLA